ncbi:hypothetical protein Gasu2_37540 [Galdieria sulphuraria]|nr:hypothetical protein Gasu2_37540 [Galdieria sulphuraria]
MSFTPGEQPNKYQVPFDPREVEAQTASSSIAGAGSGDFHTYRKLKRKEMERISELEREAKEGEEKEQFEKQRLERMRKEEERTLKRALKRKKKKEKRKQKKEYTPKEFNTISNDLNHSSADEKEC